MVASLGELLAPQVVLKVVSQIRAGQGAFSQYFGFAPRNYNPDTVSVSGPNTLAGDIRNPFWRQVNAVRVPARGRAPSAGPATIPANPVAVVQVAAARFHERLPLDYEQLGNLASIMGPNSQVDPMGRNYIDRQIVYLAQRMNMAIEILSAGMARGQLYLTQSGDQLIPVLSQVTANDIQIPFNIPATNLNQLNMTGAGPIITVPWNDPAAAIISNLLLIKNGFMFQSGYPLEHAWVNSLGWRNVVTNTEVRNLAGSSNQPFAEFDYINEKSYDGMPSTEQVAILRGIPWVKWHINDEYIVNNASNIDPSISYSTATMENTVPTNNVFLQPTPSPEWCQMYHGGEPVVENPGQPAVLRRGYYYWNEYRTQPSSLDMLSLFNGLPLLYSQRCIANAQVQGF